ncbi:PVC-type heme-binding CxxCH protein [Maioricimonas sp. JC845]|uniref:PVC-type heme-binding CxxCH protein n=1 Tax=Maioricimonas sp. JC845 TaxID=3232138 RepID=UPI003459C6D7
MTTIRAPRAAGLATLLMMLVTATTALAQRDLTDIPVPDPELERETFILPEGFEVNLFAADPQIAKPIQMNFDPQGRLWIVSSEIYPHIKPGEIANDKVLVLEDTDSDGVSDKTTVFADGLLIPTAVAPGDGGVYVGASTELLHFSDTDGDGKADRRRVVLSGFGTEDTHHIVHTFRWGPEQRLYFSQSIYIHSHIETPWGVRRLNAGGIWQFQPRDLQLSVFARGLVNTWGTAFDDYGTTFATDGAGGEGINYMVPGAYYTTSYGARRILPGLNPGSPKHCGLEIVAGRHLPEDWQGSLITNDFRGHRVCRFVLTELGSGFVSQEKQEVIKSDHVAFRPVDVKIGPDGAIYVADWYNPIIQHGEVDFRDPRRDHTHGRIWRITYKPNKTLERPNLVDADTSELVRQLASPENFTRQQAMRVLTERGTPVLAELKQWVRGLDNTAENYHRNLLQALWLHQSLDVLNVELLDQLLNCSTPGARAAATRVLGDWADRIDDPLGRLEKRVSDEHARVRLEAVRALAKISRPESIEIATRALDSEMDEWLDYALWLTAVELQPIWQPALAEGTIDFDNNARHLAFALKSAGSAEAVPSLLKMLTGGDVADEDIPDVLSVVGDFGRPEDLQAVLQYAVASTEQPQKSVAALQTLLNVHQRRKLAPAGDLTELAPLLKSSTPIRRVAARLAGAWKVEALWPQLEGLIEDENRQEIADAWAAAVADYGGAQAADLLARASREPDLFEPAVIGLLKLRPRAAAKAVIDQFAVRDDKAAPALDGTNIFRAFLQRQQGPQLLTEQLEGQTIHPDAAVVALRAIGSSGQAHAELANALRAAGGITGGPRELSNEEMARLVAEVQKSGDPHRGEQIYRRTDLSCLKCHSVGDAGGQVGPNMRSLGTTAQPDYIVHAILQPNKHVKEGYQTVVVLTDEGNVVSGIKTRQTDTELLLRDAEDRLTRIPLDQIDDQANGASLMPAGLADKLTRTELVDLVAFLWALGREPEFTVTNDVIARRWEVMQPSQQASFRLRRTSYATAATDDPSFSWTRAYSRVNGDLPLSELPEIGVRNRVAAGRRGVSFVRCEIEVAAGGSGKLILNDATGLSGWLGELPLDVADAMDVELPEGTHRLTFAIDRSERQSPLKLELKTADGSPLVARFVGGK